MPLKIVESLEELRKLIGKEVTVGDWFTVTQERISAFAELLNDHQWIHEDVERARTEMPEGKT